MIRVALGVLILLAAAVAGAPAWAQTDGSQVSWSEPIEVATGGGFRGPWRMNQSRYDYVDDPTVAITDEGHIVVAWVDQARKDVMVQIYEPSGENRFQAPINVSKSPKVLSWLPRMQVSGPDARAVYILWQEIVFSGGSHGGEIFFARSHDGGRTFDDPINLSNSTAGDGKGRLTQRYWHNGSLDLALGPQGHLYAVWTEYEGTLWFSRSTDLGQHFSDPLPVAGGNPATPARGPSLSVDAEGTIYLAWTIGEDPAADIRLVTSTDQGRSFGEPRVVTESAGHADAPKIAVDRKGTLHLVYAESPAGPFQRYHIVHARSKDGGHRFDTPRMISTSHLPRFESAGFPSLSVDADDNLYVIWELYPRRGTYPRGFGFAYSTNGGESFATPTVIPGTAGRTRGVNGSLQGLLMRKLAVSGNGTIAVVNSTFRKNKSSHVWLWRGQPIWR